LSRATRLKRKREQGFTLIEVVVALALVTIVLASVGSLFATNARGVRTLEQHVALVEATRLIATSIPTGTELPADDLTGETSGHHWLMRSSLFFGGGPVVAESRFIPQLVELRVQSPSGAVILLETVRLQNRNGRR
jgi:general secretion pathway protein I